MHLRCTPFRRVFATAVFMALFSSTALCANDTIQINENQYFIDVGHKLVLTNMHVSWVNATWTNSKSHILLSEVCAFSNPISNVEVGDAYEIFIPSHNAYFTLYFTELPVVSIQKENSIGQTEEFAAFKLIEPNQNLIESNIGVRIRGGWSQSLPKKSMKIEFWTDQDGTDKENLSLLGMRSDDDWNLQAMYNEPLRVRSKTNNDLWRLINTLHYQNSEPGAINGIRMKYIELFINDAYQGLYCLSERVDRKQLRLKAHNGNIRGELHKGISWGASTFSALPAFDNNSLLWGGFEYKHPEEEIDWSNLYELVDFVMNAPSAAFYQDYPNRFDTENLVDYFIFLNLLRATDNTGKNIYIAKYDANSKYFYVPWDLDGSFGTIWDGSNAPITDDILSNGFYNRLMFDCSTNGFRQKLKDKWLALRSTLLTEDFLMLMFTENHDVLVQNGIYERESMVWPDFSLDDSGLAYLSGWISDRLYYLDMKFTEACVPMSTDGPMMDGKMFRIYPNPTANVMHIESEYFSEFNVYVYNNLGQLVFQESAHPTRHAISLAHLDNGIYFVQLVNKDFREVTKVVVAN